MYNTNRDRAHCCYGKYEFRTELGLLTGLLQLDFTNNTMSGTIPSELGRFSVLKDFQLGFNMFTGTIPQELVNIVNPSLKTLDLRNNTGLSGVLPEEFCIVKDPCFVDCGEPEGRLFSCSSLLCGCECSCNTANATVYNHTDSFGDK